MDDRLARKKIAMKRRREAEEVSVPPPTFYGRPLCKGCGAVDAHGQPTTCQQGCPISYAQPSGKRPLRKKVPSRQRAMLDDSLTPAEPVVDESLPPPKSSRREQDEVSEPEPEDPEAEADADKLPLRPARRREPAPGSIRQGWYLCVNACMPRRPFYAGYGLSKPPACTGCGSRTRAATHEEVFGEA